MIDKKQVLFKVCAIHIMHEILEGTLDLNNREVFEMFA